MNTKIRASLLEGIVISIFLILPIVTHAADGDLDLSFKSGELFDSSSIQQNINHVTVSAIAEQADGRILIGGSFATVDGQRRNAIARLHSNGELDTSFSTDIDYGSVHLIEFQRNGKIVIASGFGLIGGTIYWDIARLNQDGSVDRRYNPNPTPKSSQNIGSMAIQQDDKVLIGGNFLSVGEVSRNYIARLNVDGSLDHSFSPNLDGVVRDIFVQSDGKILISGQFRTVNGVSQNRLARLNVDGSLDVNFKSVEFANGHNVIASIVEQKDGKILIGGFFSIANTYTTRYLARLNSDGSLDPGLIASVRDLAGPDVSVPSYVNSIAEQKDGKIIVSGVLKERNDPPNAFLRRLNNDGTVDVDFDVSVNDEVLPIALQNDSKILIGGKFSSVNGVTRTQIARLENTAPPQISINGFKTRQREGDNDGTEFTFNVSREYIDLQSVSTVDYIVTGGAHPAVDANDFGGMFPQGTITFSEGEEGKTLTISVTGDSEVEPNENFVVTLSNSNNTLIDTDSAGGTIIDDDSGELCFPIQTMNKSVSTVCL